MLALVFGDLLRKMLTKRGFTPRFYLANKTFTIIIAETKDRCDSSRKRF
jgi:hypothetical protein